MCYVFFVLRARVLYVTSSRKRSLMLIFHARKMSPAKTHSQSHSFIDDAMMMTLWRPAPSVGARFVRPIFGIRYSFWLVDSTKEIDSQHRILIAHPFFCCCWCVCARAFLCTTNAFPSQTTKKNDVHKYSRRALGRTNAHIRAAAPARADTVRLSAPYGRRRHGVHTRRFAIDAAQSACAALSSVHALGKSMWRRRRRKAAKRNTVQLQISSRQQQQKQTEPTGLFGVAVVFL